MKITKFSYQSFLDNKGLLLPIDFKKELKVNIKRIFFLSGNKKFIRGDHAHKKCIQCFIQIKGNSTIELFTKNEFKSKIDNILKVIKKGKKTEEIPLPQIEVFERVRESFSLASEAELEAQQ